MSSVPNDAMFAEFAAQAEREAQERANRQSSGPSVQYEQIQWTGLETGRMKILRAVGGPPDSALDEFTARSARISWIVGDDGRRFRCVLPEPADDPEHLIWRIINRVKASEWVDGKRTYVLEKSHKQIFDIIEHNGHPEGSPQYKFDRGWTGQQKLIMNVVDREQMDWHRTNNHTMLLSKNIGVGKDGTLFPDEGVPSYGFVSLLANLFRYYKSWENYDIGIMRTGQMETPYRIINASKYFEEVPEDLQPLVSSDPISEEEAGFIRYDLNKMFSPTRMLKVQNRLKLTVARIDAALGTQYGKELDHLAETEKAELDAQNSTGTSTVVENNPIATDVNTPTPEPVSTPTRAPVRQPAASSSPQDPVWAVYLKGWSKMSDKEKAAIEDVQVTNGKVTGITYTGDEVLLSCPNCESPAPDWFLVCPVCGLDFS